MSLSLINITNANAEAPAENILYFYEDFQSASGSLVRSLEFAPNNNEIKTGQDSDGNKYASIFMNSTEESKKDGAIIKRFGSHRPHGKIVIEAKIKVSDFTLCTRMIAIRSPYGGSGEIYPVKIDSAGKVFARGKSSSCFTMKENVFYKFSIAMDLDSGIYTLYIDNAPVAENLNFKTDLTYDFSSISLLLFNVRNASAGCKSQYSIDDIKVYGADSVLSESEFSSRQWTLSVDPETNVSPEMVKLSLKDSLVFYPDAKNALCYGELIEANGAVFTKDNLTCISADFVNEICNKIVSDDEYVSAKDLAHALGMNIFSDKTGLVILSPSELGINWRDNLSYLSAVCGEMVYERPGGAEVLDKMKNLYPQKKHPRIFVEGSFDKLKEEINTEPLKAKWYSDIKLEADKWLVKKVSTYGVTDGVRMSDQALQLLDVVTTCGFVYKIEGGEKYLNRCIAEIEAIVSFPDWNPNHFLDVGRFMQAVSLCYDWLYDDLAPKLKSQMRISLRDKALKEVMKDYLFLPRDRGYHWSEAPTGDNWNTVINSGALMAALAIGDEEGYEALCSDVISNGLVSLENAFDMLAPDGSWYEGVAYWTQTSRTMIWAMKALITASGSDYGLFNVPGLKYSGYYLYEQSGSTGIFNFNYAAYRGYVSPWLVYFADRLGDESLKKICIDHMEKYGEKGSAEAIFLCGKSPDENTKINLPLDSYYRGAETVSMRNSWNDEDMIFVGFHSGDNDALNGQLDAGTFVIDAYGDRFIHDLGVENYNLAGNFEKYRNRAEGNNCYIINPSTNFYDQTLQAFCYMKRYESNDISALAVTDLTDAYSDKVTSAVRGIKMTNNRKSIVLQDEIRCINPSEIYWGVHTPADVTLSDDGKTAMLSIDGNMMEARILSKDGTFSLLEAKPLPQCYQLDGQTENKGITKLTVHFENIETVDLTVCFTPLGRKGGEVKAYPEVKAIDDWTLDGIGASIEFSHAAPSHEGKSSEFNFDGLTPSANGTYYNSTDYHYPARTAYSSDSVSFADCFLSNEADGSGQRLTLKSNKDAHFGVGIRSLSPDGGYSGEYNFECSFSFDDFLTNRHIGVYDCWHSSSKPTFMQVTRDGYFYIMGKAVEASKIAAIGKQYDLKATVNTGTGEVVATLFEDGKEFVTVKNTWDVIKGHTLNSLYFYQDNYRPGTTDGSIPVSVSHFDNLRLCEITESNLPPEPAYEVKEGKVIANVTYFSNDSKSYDAVLWIALYDGNTLEDTKISKIKVTSEKQNAEISIDVPKACDGYKIKAGIWHENMLPAKLNSLN